LIPLPALAEKEGDHLHNAIGPELLPLEAHAARHRETLLKVAVQGEKGYF